MIFKTNKYNLILAACLILSGVLGSCTDDLTLAPEKGPWDPYADIDLENHLLVPLTISMDGIGASTRDGESDFQDGLASDHIIDFGTENECYAFFFKTDKTNTDKEKYDFVALRPLMRNASLGTPGKPEDGLGEYQTYAFAYIKKPIGWENLMSQKDKSEQQIAEDKQAALDLLPDRILVVLNGGRVYDEILKSYPIDPATGYYDSSKGDNITADKILEFKWNYEMGNPMVLDEPDQDKRRLQVIGINTDGHYTMTNSAYYGPDDEADPIYNVNNSVTTSSAQFKLQTVRPIDRQKIVDGIASNITPDNCAATIYVERMVARFSAPKFSTEVIGSNKVFRPSQDANPVVIYSYNSATKTWLSEEVNWRVHVLGWTINGREKENYLFKHIRDAWNEEANYKTVKWNKETWNDPKHRRSYWSIDPHYLFDTNNESPDLSGDFYPWQYRGAMDKSHISWFHQNNESENKIALRYLKFNEVKYWDDNAITISENTFNPYLNDNSDECLINSNNYLDTRGSMLMGPHLLVTAEIYLEGKTSNNDYIDQFSKVQNLYGDRYFRYFRTEENMFRMFVRDINDALHTQSTMSFTYYDWDVNATGNNGAHKYVAKPTGHCQMMLDLSMPEENYMVNGKLTEEGETYHTLLEYNSKNDNALHGKEVADVIDILVGLKIPLSVSANIKDGDARVLPWVPGIVFRNTGDFEKILDVYDNDSTDKSSADGKHHFTEWDDNMRKSMILEWYGPVDHYANGYMYYAADIPHHLVNESDNDSKSKSKEGYYGAVRNHWYTFTVTAINSLGTPIDDPEQRIIPEKYKYRDQMSVYVEPAGWHFIPEVDIKFQ